MKKTNNRGARRFMQWTQAGLLMCLFGFSAQAFSWSFQGHKWIAQSAAEHLAPRELEAYDALLKGGKVVPAKLYHAPVSERLAALAAWPDSQRDSTIKELFNTFGSGTVPNALKAYSKRSGADWHYANVIFVDAGGEDYDGKCQPKPSGKLVSGWPHLLEAFSEVDDPRDKNVILALALHFAADAYQPLHLMSAVDKKCNLDRGGNGLCAVPGEKGKKCAMNLHQLWDKGFGVFDQQPVWLNKRHPTNVYKFTTAEDLARKAQKNVYQAEGRYHSPEYNAQATEVVAVQTDYAIGHTKFLMQLLLTK